MTALADGAVELPPAHLSARVAWHDTDWTGRVCEAPGANHSCAVLKNIKEKKNADLEEEDAGRSWADLEHDRVPPCVTERAGFMRPQPFSYVREHAYSGGWTKSHAHFADTTQFMPAYSLEATPFRWVMRSDASELARTWGIDFNSELEDVADQIIELRNPTTWVQDHRNQLALLDSFFSGVVPGHSLVFLYAKDVPLLEDRAPGARILLGVGRVSQVHPVAEWEYSHKGPLRSIMWERNVTHSIRPSFDDGFLLPYHELLAKESLGGLDLSPFIAIAPGDHFDEFSYVSERVGDDAAIAALTELARVVDLLPGVADGPWDSVGDWIGERLADTWETRGAYPGLGSTLAAAGLERGPVLAHRVIESLDDPGADPWPALEQAMVDASASQSSGPAAGLIGRVGRKMWERISGKSDRYALLKLLSRFSLTIDQARRLFDADTRGATDREVLQNPYLIYELDRGEPDGVGFSTVDRGLFPRSAAARAALDYDALPEPVDEAGDDRRVRAASVAVLERAADEGHTVLDEPGLRKRLAATELEPLCDPTSGQFELAAESFPPTLLETAVANDGGRAWQLRRLAETTSLIADAATQRIESGCLAVEMNWRRAIDEAIDQEMPPPDDPDFELEQRARLEKASALETLTRSRIGALVGPAGTGKTTMLKALCSNQEATGTVLLLAPTGKARVQLADIVGTQARTLAQFLRKAERWDWEHGYHLNSDGMRFGGFRTVIVDEASMLTEEMLAALIEALIEPERLILCGDHRQLPPIGAGRPFSDLIAKLRELSGDPSSGGGLAELTVGRRQRADGGSGGQNRIRTDLAVAASFTSDQTPTAADQALARASAGDTDGTLSIVSWSDEDDLHAKIVESLCSDPALGLSAGDADSLKRSLGATGEYKGRSSFEDGRGGTGAERWQVLSPVRSRVGGITGLNRLIRREWRSGDAALARINMEFPNPMGADEVLFHDKVMCLENRPRKARNTSTQENESAEVANGEIGMAVGWPKKKGRGIGLWVEFSTQPESRFTFWESELNGGAEAAQELLAVAYAITIHKAQGSQFERTFVVVPNPSPLLSPELLYTALTRHRESTVLLVQGDPMALLELANPARSETARRLTCLFRAPDPFTTPQGVLLDGSHVHRSANKELMRSKSEVIVANTLRSLGIEYSYEELLYMPDGSVREPDFTIRKGERPVYWEHLGMLDLAGYRADWEAKLAWYAKHDIKPWTEGGGSAGTLVWSTEGQDGPGIDAREIERLATEVFGV